MWFWCYRAMAAASPNQQGFNMYPVCYCFFIACFITDSQAPPWDCTAADASHYANARIVQICCDASSQSHHHCWGQVATLVGPPERCSSACRFEWLAWFTTESQRTQQQSWLALTTSKHRLPSPAPTGRQSGCMQAASNNFWAWMQPHLNHAAPVLGQLSSSSGKPECVYSDSIALQLSGNAVTVYLSWSSALSWSKASKMGPYSLLDLTIF